MVQVSAPRQVLAIKADHGEHPLWNEAEQALYWLDMTSRTVNRFDPATGENTARAAPDIPGCFAFGPNGELVLAARTGIHAMVFATGKTRLLAPALHDSAVLRFNDGKTDRQGRLWSGTSRVDNDPTQTGANAYFRYDGTALVEMLTGIGLPNGTAFSADGLTMYRAQTETRQIWAYDYDPATGTPSNPRIFAVVPDELGMPDGATVDTFGGYWVALATPPGGGTAGVARFAPDGTLSEFVPLPVPLTTMVAFGGADLSTLYVVTARMEALDLYEMPEVAGSIFAIDTGYHGVPEVPFGAMAQAG